MAIDYEFTVEGNTLRSKAAGFDENLLDTLKYSTGIVRACIKHRCDHVLLDERQLEYKLDTGDTFNLAQFVASLVTDLAWVEVDAQGFLLREIAPGLTVDDVKAATAAPLRVASDVREMQFGVA